MPTDDYTTTARGALKIKGVSGSKIEKSHKKKKKKHPKPAQDEGAPTGSSSLGVDDGGEGEVKSIAKGRDVEGKDAGDEVVGSRRGEEGEGDEGESERGGRKTEAEKAFEERRRRMLDERLKREGIKTHKERVEALNKYLSGLSEHHDMPRIGPG